MHSRTDTEGRLLWTSPRSVALIGYEPEELIGKRLIEFAHPDDLQALNAASAVASEHGAAELEYRVRQAWPARVAARPASCPLRRPRETR